MVTSSWDFLFQVEEVSEWVSNSKEKKILLMTVGLFGIRLWSWYGLVDKFRLLLKVSGTIKDRLGICVGDM